METVIRKEDGTAEQAMESMEDAVTQRRKKLFGDCALIEIIHLHDCLRGAVSALQKDVNELSQSASASGLKSDIPPPSEQNQQHQQQQQSIEQLERRVAGRFKVIWSVFRAHSSAEDEFIWPALQSKTQGRVKHHSPRYEPGVEQRSTAGQPSTSVRPAAPEAVIEQSEYEDDHKSEEQMFETIDALLVKLRKAIMEQKEQGSATTPGVPATGSTTIRDTALALAQHTQSLSKHLYEHLEKEETQCMPLVVKHLTRSEIHDLVGKIMGKRSSDLIAQIMTMAVQNLTNNEREEMIKYMKQAMEGTFFDRWLLMAGWMQKPKDNQQPTTGSEVNNNNAISPAIAASSMVDAAREVPVPPHAHAQSSMESACSNRKRPAESESLETAQKRQHVVDDTAAATTGTRTLVAASSDAKRRDSLEGTHITGQNELEQLIRAVASNPSLTPVQKNTTIQGLRDSVWKRNKRQREKGIGQSSSTMHQFAPQASVVTSGVGSAAVSAAMVKMRRTTPPSVYMKKNKAGKVEFVWNSDSPSAISPNDASVPLFSAAELAPTYHDGATGAVLGCPHYARACKLRHPKSGRLYTCRLCCEQDRDMPMKDKDEPLDRYSVTEIMCMKCNALQPCDDRCNNPHCESTGKPFAKYYCRICHLYDDRPHSIFHCPYCNTCRMGLGLGIDYRHCMRCNACVSLADDDHRCIPQKLQGSCPICHESMFSSTEPLRGLKCGHVMHLSCFTMYRRGHSFTCPLCQRSMEDMSDHFRLLDAAVRMQPMPAAYLSTVSHIYCQDCSKTGQVQYHFVGCKCPSCGSYNTREMSRVQNRPALQTAGSTPL